MARPNLLRAENLCIEQRSFSKCVTAMKRTLIFSLFVFAFATHPAFGQIEVNQDGNVQIGDVTTPTHERVSVEYDALNDTAKVVSAEYTGFGDYRIRAVFGKAVPNPAYGYGGYFEGGYIGALGVADVPGPGDRFGINAVASNGAEGNYGLYGGALGGKRAFGVYAFASGGSQENYAGFFNGKVFAEQYFGPSSDRRLKEDIQEIDGAQMLAKLAQIQPVSFRYLDAAELRAAGFAKKNLPAGRRFGVVAQDLEKVFPQLVDDEVYVPPKVPGQKVDTENRTFKSINYMEMIPLLLRAIQEQQAQIETLKAGLKNNGINIPAGSK